MDSMFSMGFARGSFRPLQLSARRLGQEGIDPLTPMEPVSDTPTIPGLYTSIDQMPDTTTPVPGLYTSLQQDTRPTEPVPGLITSLTPKIPDKQPAGTSDTDWAKILASGLKAAGEGYGAYTKADIARMNAEAAQLKARNPEAAALIPSSLLSGSSSNTPYIVMGAVLVGLLGVLVAVS